MLPASVTGMPPILGLSFDTQAAMAEDLSQSAIREVAISLDVAQVDRNERAQAMAELSIWYQASLDSLFASDVTP